MLRLYGATGQEESSSAYAIPVDVVPYWNCAAVEFLPWRHREASYLFEQKFFDPDAAAEQVPRVLLASW